MKRLSHVAMAALLVVLLLNATGCGLNRLKDDNRRLKESNDRLISENNRLEEQLVGMHKRVEDLQAMPAPASGLALADPAPPMPSDLMDPDLLLSGMEGTGITVVKTSDGVRFRIPEQVFFGLGQISLSTRGQATLDKVARLIRTQYPGQLVRVDGHTDDVPINRLRARYPTNWELSTARACTVVKYLVEKGLDRRGIFAAGFGEYAPVVTGTSSSARSKNRRVEILVLDKTSV